MMKKYEEAGVNFYYSVKRRIYLYRLEQDIAPKEKLLDPLWSRSGFLCILTGYFKLGLGLTIAPQLGLKPLAGARSRSKVTVNIRRNPSRYQTDQVRQF